MLDRANIEHQEKMMQQTISRLLPELPYDQAASHHRRASQHYAERDHALAARQAIIAHGHMQQAVRHGNEATKYHLEHDKDSLE